MPLLPALADDLPTIEGDYTSWTEQWAVTLGSRVTTDSAVMVNAFVVVLHALFGGDRIEVRRVSDGTLIVGYINWFLQAPEVNQVMRSHRHYMVFVDCAPGVGCAARIFKDAALQQTIGPFGLSDISHVAISGDGQYVAILVQDSGAAPEKGTVRLYKGS